MRNKNKKMELAAKSNTRCVYCNTPETKIFLDLIVNIDKMYNYIRKNTGATISPENGEKYRKNFLLLAMQVEKKLESIAQESGYQNFTRSVFIKAILDTTLNEQEG